MLVWVVSVFFWTRFVVSFINYRSSAFLLSSLLKMSYTFFYSFLIYMYEFIWLIKGLWIIRKRNCFEKLHVEDGCSCISTYIEARVYVTLLSWNFNDSWRISIYSTCLVRMNAFFVSAIHSLLSCVVFSSLIHISVLLMFFVTHNFCCDFWYLTLVYELEKKNGLWK